MKRLVCLVVTLLWMLPAFLQAQNITISGQVKSSTGESLGAVSVTLKGSPSGTFTDNKGNFNLSVPSSTKFPATLIFSSIGYESIDSIRC
jgi:CarboxypepD_reg-like domain